MSEQPISIHYQQMEEWLNDRKSVFGKKNKKEFHALLALAPRLVQQVQYDIPAIQKQAKKCSSGMEECSRVCEDADRVVASTADKRRRLLDEYELLPADGDGDLAGGAGLQAAIERRIDESRRRLTRELLSFAKAALADFRESYNGVLRRTYSRDAGPKDADMFAAHFPWLDRLGEECTYAVAGEAQGMDEEERLIAGNGEDGSDAPPPQIDWGDDTTADAPMTGLGQEEAATAVEIDWDAAVEGERAAPGDDVAAIGGRGDVDGGEGTGEFATDLPPAPNGRFLSLDVARTRDRTNLLTELSACKCFAGERVELKDMHFLPLHTALDAVVTALTRSVEAEFVRMRTNFRERDMFEERMACFDRAIGAAHTRKASHQAKLLESKKELEMLEPQLQALLDTARATRDECLENLSHIFPGRKIMIVGDINKYL